ncbi:superinfection immunity protein [Candidatus Albibeggiatoa sp. nov. BB20]|uniref:superinfection immunity protein n=1 Tax=Candidatus Albibeggiatoa sp. nov. BB20 TaxID=3162723 RepID=UPI0033657FA5
MIAKLLSLFLMVGFVVTYLLPSMIAINRSHPYQASIIILNILLGWTLIFYAITLAWAVSPIKDNNNY